MMNLKLNGAASSANRWGIVLSGGNGTELREWVYPSRGDYLPRQYLNFIGKQSMLEHTLQRAEKLIVAQKLLTVIAKGHLQFDAVRRQIAWRPQGSVIIQPADRDTAPGILLALMHLQKRDPAAVVTILPSNHLIVEEALFMQHVERALRIVESDPSRAVLLGTQPYEPDPEYGYILTAGRIDDRDLDEPSTVEMFIEKPSADSAKMIMKRGALWNTLVLVGTCKTLLQAIMRAAPGLYRSFEPIQDAIATPNEQRVTERVYQSLPSISFSKAVLEVFALEHRRLLLVLPVRGGTWCDWGTADPLSSRLRASESVQPASARQDTQQVASSYNNTVTASNVPVARLTAVRKT